MANNLSTAMHIAQRIESPATTITITASDFVSDQNALMLMQAIGIQGLPNQQFTINGVELDNQVISLPILAPLIDDSTIQLGKTGIYELDLTSTGGTQFKSIKLEPNPAYNNNNNSTPVEPVIIDILYKIIYTNGGGNEE